MKTTLDIETPLFYSTRGVSGRQMPEPLAHQWPEVYDNTGAVVVPEPLAGEGQTPIPDQTGHEPGGCCIGGTCNWLFMSNLGAVKGYHGGSHFIWWQGR